MIMKNFKICVLAVWGILSVSCGLDPVEWQDPDRGSEQMAVVIDPLISRVTGTAFDTGDRIGLKISNSEGVYLENQLLTYNGTLFTGSDLIWYNNINLKADLVAYYPYQESSAPSTFTIATDQSASGFAASDLLAATKTNVTPSTSAVPMIFYHLLSKISIEITNASDGQITSIQLGGSRPSATVDLANRRVAVSMATESVNIIPHTKSAGTRYEAIVVPQECALTLTVATNDGKTHTHTMVESELLGGKIYTLAVTLTNIDLSASLSGQIEDWEQGGVIEESGSTGDTGSGVEDESNNDKIEGPATEGLTYGGVSYATATLADGRVWMVENLRYNPAGSGALAAGVYLPGETLTSEQDLTTYGLLYTAAAALGVSEITGDNAASLEGSQGLCPEGWHLPTEGEFKALFAAYPEGLPAEFSFETPYWYNPDKYVANSNGAILLTSTPTSVAKSSKIQVALFYSDGNTSTTDKPNTLALPMRCIKNQ